MIDRYEIADDTLEHCTGLSKDNEQDRFLIDCIRCGDIDLNECVRTRRDRSGSDYRQ